MVASLFGTIRLWLKSEKKGTFVLGSYLLVCSLAMIRINNWDTLCSLSSKGWGERNGYLSYKRNIVRMFCVT